MYASHMHDIINCNEFDMCCDAGGILIMPRHKKRHTCVSSTYFVSPWELHVLKTCPPSQLSFVPGERCFKSCILGYVDDSVYMIHPIHDAYNAGNNSFLNEVDVQNMTNWFVYQLVTR